MQSGLRVLPLHFEENRGQAPPAVKYLARSLVAVHEIEAADLP